MYFFDRKTMYLVWKKKEVIRKSVGNVRFLVIEDLCRVEISVTNCGNVSGSFLVEVLSGENSSVLGQIKIEHGKGNGSMRCSSNGLGDKKIPYTLITGVRIDMRDEGVVEQKWLPVNGGYEEEINEISDMELTKQENQREVKALSTDKWQQLCNIYPIVHPFEDGRAYLSIEPRDFVVLHGKYHGLVENSFLLHGFYQKRHILLGRSRRGGRTNYYIGVPGVYCEKEKNMARIHGFESFEAKEEVARTGSVGYYLKRVEL